MPLPSIKFLRTLCILLLPALCHATTLYVSPDGNDANPGTVDRPFASPEKAIESVRQELAKRKDHPEPINVIFRSGVYRLIRPLKFTPEDSGTAEAPVTYAAAPGEEVVFSGGVPITGVWTQTPGKPFWQITVSKAKDRGWVFNSLYVNGLSRTRARSPREGVKELRGEGPEPGGDPRRSLRYLPGDFNPDWTNPNDIDVVLLGSWASTIHRIREILPEKRSLRFHRTDIRTVDFWERSPRYYLSNVFEALDEPGEWYLNRQTGVLYYYPLPGEDLAKAEVEAPVMKSRLMEFDGDLVGDRPVEYLRFRDLHFRSMDSDLDRYDGQYRQGYMFLDAAVFAQGLRHASFERCEFSQLGEYAMELADGCRDVTVRQCHFWDLGAGAMQLGVTDLGTLKTPTTPGAKPGASMEPRREVLDLTVDNNLIHRLGTVWHGCYGIVNRFASGTKITHNEIFDTHYTAVGLDARWDWKGEKYSHGNEIAYNHLHHLGLGYQTDGAGIYQFGPLDTHIHHNLIHDTYAYPYISGMNGFYLDETSRGAVVENNLAYNLDWSAFHQNHGDDNIVRNNIVAFARDGFFKRGGFPPKEKINYLEVTRNIYITRDDKAQAYDWEPGNKPPIFNHNIYFSLSPGAQLSFAGKSFADWQASGHDKDSLIMDPGCRDPGKFDFTLPASAPACRAIGFVPFDEEIKKAGLYGDTKWRESIKMPPARKFLPAWTEGDLSRFNEFDIDPNQFKDGNVPPVLTAHGVGVYAVTRKVAGSQGPACIQCSSQQRYICTTLHDLKNGKVTFSFAVMQPAVQPTGITFEMRSGGNPYLTGVSIAIAGDGQIKTGSEIVGRLQPGKWTRFEGAFSLGDGTPQSYTLKIHDDQGEKTGTHPFLKKGVKDIQWVGFVFSSHTEGSCYLDDLHLKINKP